MDERYSLTKGHIGKVLLRFALPFLLSSFLQALYGAVDLFVVGQYADSAAVSAVSIGSQVMQTITGIILGISMGGTVLIGRCVGERSEKGAAKAVGTLTVLFIILAAVLTPVMLLCTNGSVAIMETPPEAVAYTRTYILICACGIPFIVGYNAVSGIFRGIGDSKTPVYFIAIACAINIAGDFLLTGLLHMGAAGAAIATISAQGISFLISLLYLYKKGLAFPFSKKDLRLDGFSLRTILKVGIPIALQDALVNVSFLVITAIINVMGLVASAAVGVVEKIIVFAMLPPNSFASAVATATAQNAGAGREDRALASLRWGIGFSLVFGIAVCVYSQFGAQTLAAIFTNDDAVIKAAGEYLRYYSIDCILVSFVFCMNSYFSGEGRAIVSFVHSMIATFGVRIPMTYLLSRTANGSLLSMGLAAPAASAVSILICFGYLIWMYYRRKHTANAA